MNLKSSILTILPLLALSCSINSEDEKAFDYVLPSSPEVLSSTKTRATEEDFKVHLNEAMRYARLVKPEKEIESIVPYVQEGDTLMYYVYYNDGWKLLSGDKRIQPELINEPTGKRTAEELCDGEKITVQEYVEFLSALKDYPYADKDTQYLDFWNKIGNKKPKKEEPKTRTVWDPTLESYPWLFHKIVCEQDHPSYIIHTYEYNTGNITDTQWGQGNPWNTKIPSNIYDQKAPLGCVAVAVSQLLYYLYQEKNLDLGLYDSVSMGGSYVDNYLLIPIPYFDQYVFNSTLWNDMALTSSGSSAGISYAQDLMIVVGVGVNTSYTVDRSGSDITYAQLYLNSKGISSSLSGFSSSIVYSSIDNGFPVLIQADGYNINGGHDWLIDGHIIKEAKLYEYYRWELVYPSDPDFSPVYGDEYLTPDEVDDLGYYIYDGLEGFFLAETCYPEYIMMNWGYNGAGRGTEYIEPSTSSYWSINNSVYGPNKQMLYNYSFPTRQ